LINQDKVYLHLLVIEHKICQPMVPSSISWCGLTKVSQGGIQGGKQCTTSSFKEREPIKFIIN
jgi:hypothetical protein